MEYPIHVHVDLDDPLYKAATYAFRVLLATVQAPLMFHRERPSFLPREVTLVTYSRSRVEPFHGKHLVIGASRDFWDHYGTEASVPRSPLARFPLAALRVQPNARLKEPFVLPYTSQVVPPTAEFSGDATRTRASIVTGVDVVASALFWITAYEETLIRERDEVGRIPQRRLTLLRERLMTRALVDEYCELVVRWLDMLGTPATSKAAPFRAALTHDVDSGIGVRGLRQHVDHGIRTLFREIIRQRRPWTGLLGAGQWTLRGLGLLRETTMFRDIVALDAEFGFRSFFFLMANGTHPRDATYDVGSPAVRRVIAAIREAGADIGLHVGLNAHGAPDRLRSEWEALRRADPEARPVARSHYLAFFPPVTWRHLSALGFTADSTMGFSRHIGFRCGTCRAFKPYDVERHEILPIWELPMSVMDIDLFLGQPGESDAARIAAVAELSATVRAHGGCMVVNWHNIHYVGHYREVYRAILAGLRGAQSVSPDEIPVNDGAMVW
jgi:hypothetical protein